MTEFKEGDRVKCVDDLCISDLTLGHHYTVDEIYSFSILKVEGCNSRLSVTRFELVEPAMKVGDMVEVSQNKCFPYGHTYKRELLADLSGKGISEPFICRDGGAGVCSPSWKYARPIQEPKIELTVNGEPVEISAETLAAIKEAI